MRIGLYQLAAIVIARFVVTDRADFARGKLERRWNCSSWLNVVLLLRFRSSPEEVLAKVS